MARSRHLQRASAFLDALSRERAQVVLTENYRSHQAILDAAYRLIVHNNPDRLEVAVAASSKHLVAVREAPGPSPRTCTTRRPPRRPTRSPS